MIELNKVMIVGRLTRDPELRALPSGSAVANFGVAVGRTRKDSRSGEYVEDTCFVDVTAWNKTAEFVERYFQKGKGIFIEGRLHTEQWERDGQKRSKLVVVAENVGFAESKAEEEQRLARSGGGGSGSSRYGSRGSSPARQDDRRSDYDRGGDDYQDRGGSDDRGGYDNRDMPATPGDSNEGGGGAEDDLPF